MNVSAEDVSTTLCARRRGLVASQLEHLAAAFPAVRSDARLYRQASVNAPWELYDVLNPEEPIRSLREKYQLATTKHRPHPDDVPPLTNLFFVAFALVVVDQLAKNRLGSLPPAHQVKARPRTWPGSGRCSQNSLHRSWFLVTRPLVVVAVGAHLTAWDWASRNPAFTLPGGSCPAGAYTISAPLRFTGMHLSPLVFTARSSR